MVAIEEGNDEDIDVYILQCQKPKHVVQELFTCSWSDKFEVGDQVVINIYYHKWGRGEFSYVYLSNFQITFIDVNLVLACKFPMLLACHRVNGGNVVYQLLEETLEVIKISM
jgi:hypothetical protein